MVTNYIANGNTDMLLMFDTDKRNTPSPRSWSRVGELLYDLNIDDFSSVNTGIMNFIHEAVIGTVGANSADSFMRFGETFTSYIQVEDWLGSTEEEFEQLLIQYTTYDNTKKALMVENLIAHMLEEKERALDDTITQRVARVLGKAPMDTITNQLRLIAREFNELFRGERTKVNVGDEASGIYQEETLEIGQVRYIQLVNSNMELKTKQKRIINNSQYEQADELEKAQ